MSDANPFAFGKFIPGFDFLQQLTSAPKAGGAGVPGLGQWVAPTVSVEELDKRITELKAVQFWLEQNVIAVKATVQALEVQKMTLATLKDMNVSMAEVAKAFTVAVPPASTPAAAPAQTAAAAAQGWPFDQAAGGDKTSAASPAPVQAAPAPAAAAPESEPPAQPAPSAARKSKAKAPTAAQEAEATANAAAARMADGMQWWNALTQQFQQIAANALSEAAPVISGAPAAQGAPSRPAATPKAAAKKAPAQRRATKKTAAAKKKAASAKRSSATDGAAREPAAQRNAGWPLPPPAKRR